MKAPSPLCAESSFSLLHNGSRAPGSLAAGQLGLRASGEAVPSQVCNAGVTASFIPYLGQRPWCPLDWSLSHSPLGQPEKASLTPALFLGLPAGGASCHPSATVASDLVSLPCPRPPLEPENKSKLMPAPELLLPLNVLSLIPLPLPQDSPSVLFFSLFLLLNPILLGFVHVSPNRRRCSSPADTVCVRPPGAPDR